MVMTREMRKKAEKDGRGNICVCDMCVNYKYCLANDKEQEKFIQSICLDKWSAEVFVWVTAILIGIFLGYVWCHLAINGTVAKKNAEILQYKIALEDAQEVQSTKEWQAINKCKDGDYWKAECIAWELNTKKENR